MLPASRFSFAEEPTSLPDSYYVTPRAAASSCNDANFSTPLIFPMDGPHGTGSLTYAKREYYLADYDERVAFQEAGQLMFYFLAGDRDQVWKMQGTRTDSRIPRRAETSSFFLAEIEMNPRCGRVHPASAKFWMRIAVKELFVQLGDSAVSNLVFHDDPQWLESEMRGMTDPAYGCGRAWQLALYVEPSVDRALRLIRRVALWCDEILRHQRVWRSVYALAEYMHFHPTVTIDDCFEVLNRSWENPASPPSAQLPRR